MVLTNFVRRDGIRCAFHATQILEPSEASSKPLLFPSSYQGLYFGSCMIYNEGFINGRSGERHITNMDVGYDYTYGILE